MTRRRLIPVLTAAALVAVSCSGSGDDAVSTDTAVDTVAETTPADTDPPATDPPATDPPATDPPATDPPATDPPATDPPATDPPATDPPATTVAPREYDFSAVGPIVEAFVAERELNGAGLVIVQRDDGVVHEDYWGEFSADRVSLIASSSKMISAGVLLHLDDEGVLDVDAPVADVAGWGSANPTITPAQLLSNSSGLVGLLPNPGYAPYICQYLYTESLQGCAESIFTTADDDDGVIAPDSEFRYGGAQWTVAGAVAEVASGQTWDELIDEIYVEPCGVESLAFNNHFSQMGAGFNHPVEFNGDPSTLESTANPNPEGGAYINAPDYGQLLLMHLRDGMCGDTQVLSPEALDVMHADRIGAAYDGNASAVPTAETEGTGYGMGWWVNRDTGQINDPGAYGSVPWLDLDDGYGVYLVIEADSGTGSELAALINAEIHTAITS